MLCTDDWQILCILHLINLIRQLGIELRPVNWSVDWIIIEYFCNVLDVKLATEGKEHKRRPNDGDVSWYG